MPPCDSDNALTRWIARCRRFSAIRTGEAMWQRWVVQQLRAVRAANARATKRMAEHEAMERKKFGWEEGEEPPPPMRPW